MPMTTLPSADAHLTGNTSHTLQNVRALAAAMRRKRPGRKLSDSVVCAIDLTVMIPPTIVTGPAAPRRRAAPVPRTPRESQKLPRRTIGPWSHAAPTGLPFQACGAAMES
jgi:hypothetical protein